MAVQQILNENNQYVSKDFLNPEIEVSQISFSGGQENPVRVGLTGDVEGEASIGVGYQATTSGDHSVAIGHAASSANRGVSIGRSGVVSAENGVAVGNGANTSSGVAVGHSSNAAEGSAAFGADCTAAKSCAAFGHSSNAAVENSIAIGNTAVTNFGSQLVIQTNNSSAIAPAASRKGLYTDAIDSVAADTVDNKDFRINYNSNRKELFMVAGSDTNYNIKQAVVLMPSLPTSTSGLTAGQLWRDAANSNVLKVVPPS